MFHQIVQFFFFSISMLKVYTPPEGIKLHLGQMNIFNK